MGRLSLVRALFKATWSGWIDEGYVVEQVKSWRSARFIKPNGGKVTYTFCPWLTWKAKREIRRKIKSHNDRRRLN